MQLDKQSSQLKFVKFCITGKDKLHLILEEKKQYKKCSGVFSH